MRLSEVSRGRDNNLNLIRMLAAVAVLVSHAYPISLGTGTAEPLKAQIGLSLGTVAVYVFFLISGFLIAKSYDSGKGLVDWAAARVLRLFPGLFVALTLTVVLLGPAVTSLGLREFFTSPATLTYVPRNMALVSEQFGLPGVFEDNPLPQAINGSLWTLFYEVLCYLGVPVLGLMGAFGSRSRMVTALCAFAALEITISYLGPGVHYKVAAAAGLAPPFVIGTAFYIWRDSIPLRPNIGVVLAVVGTFLRIEDVLPFLFIIALAYNVFLLAYLPGGAIRKYNHLGDYSYGIYIYAFPMQQLAVWLFGPQTPVANMATAGVATLILAILSWHIVERKALASKAQVARFLHPPRRI